MSLVAIFSGFAIALRASIASAGLLTRRRRRTWRVLVLGGRGTECERVAAPDSWPEVARRFLERPENLELLGVDRARVENLGCSGATCRRMQSILQEEVRSGDPLDALVLEAGAEDLLDPLDRELPIDARPAIARMDADLRALIECARARARTVVIVRPSWLAERCEDDVRRLLERVDRRVAFVAREAGAAEVDPKLLIEPLEENYVDGIRLASKGCAVLGVAVAQALLRERKGRYVSRPPALREQRHADVA